MDQKLQEVKERNSRLQFKEPITLFYLEPGKVQRADKKIPVFLRTREVSSMQDVLDMKTAMSAQGMPQIGGMSLEFQLICVLLEHSDLVAPQEESE